MPRQKKGAGGSAGFLTDWSAIELGAADFAGSRTRVTTSHIPDKIRERIEYLRDEGYEVLADELYDQYTEDAG